ncbi:uncharacterized protein HfgLR_12870 [Haloferax gibbonsii]|uniref:Uncharacterized protein n=1 Tax=Haloferax gibbonsii TaxID=35746 RepID=A0A871BIS2_HALGI|nr:uncharacterized protein HfgLR_12870 [Haloferax gibbonsii]
MKSVRKRRLRNIGSDADQTEIRAVNSNRTRCAKNPPSWGSAFVIDP